jgi:hypothetical protein
MRKMRLKVRSYRATDCRDKGGSPLSGLGLGRLEAAEPEAVQSSNEGW